MLFFNLPVSHSLIVSYDLVRCGGTTKYPLLFIMRNNRNLQFVGNEEEIQSVLDNGYVEGSDADIPLELQTFERYFHNIYQ